MNILHKGYTVEVKAVKSGFLHANIVGVGKRRLYKDTESNQVYVKCFNKWFMFPQEVEY